MKEEEEERKNETFKIQRERKWRKVFSVLLPRCISLLNEIYCNRLLEY